MMRRSIRNAKDLSLPLDNQKGIAQPAHSLFNKECKREGQVCTISVFFVIIEKDEDGYTAFCPELQGCYVQGETYEEVLDNIRDAIRLHLDDRIESKEKIPQAQLINLTTVDVPV